LPVNMVTMGRLKCDKNNRITKLNDGINSI
jgi:hypothetical protein